ncbi:MAG: metallophosphoesterase [Pseudomonadota bacterium]
MDRDFLLAHLSDPHLPPPAGAGGREISKRLLARLSWRWRRRALHRPEALAAVLEDMAAARPDHVAVTGDLTNFGASEEFAAGADWLAGLGPAGAVSFVPGNHDALVAGAWEAGRARLAPFCAGDDGGTAMPWLRRRGPLALIGLTSAVPAPPGLASGRVDAPQAEAAASLLRAARRDGAFRAVLIHHPPAGSVPWRKALRAPGPLLAALAREGAELILHGHLHRAAMAAVPGPVHPIPALGAPSASMRPGARDAAAAWRALRVTRRAGGWRVALVERGLDAALRPRDVARASFDL